MNSQPTTAPPPNSVPAIWRLLACVLFLAAVAFAVAVLLGFARVEFGPLNHVAAHKDKVAEKGGPKKDEQPVKTLESEAPYIQRDLEMEETLKLVSEDVLVFRFKGAKLSGVWLEDDSKGKTGTTDVKLPEDGAQVKGMIVLVKRKGGVFDLTQSQAGATGKLQDITFTPPQPSSKSNITFSQSETLTKKTMRPGDEIVLHKIEDQEQVMKKNDNGGLTSDKTITRRTVRLMCKVAAVQAGEAQK